jgi:putative FmdB family regulatory protein
VPTYQYACTECGHSFEEHQSFTDDALTECPTCGGRLRKLFNSVGIVFKGSGFYRNDSREAAKKDAAANVKGEDSKDSPKKDSKDSSSTKDNKSDGKSDGKDKKPDSKPAPASSSGSSSSGSSSSGNSSSGRSSSTSGNAA